MMVWYRGLSPRLEPSSSSSSSLNGGDRLLEIKTRHGYGLVKKSGMCPSTNLCSRQCTAAASIEGTGVFDRTDTCQKLTPLLEIQTSSDSVIFPILVVEGKGTGVCPVITTGWSMIAGQSNTTKESTHSSIRSLFIPSVFSNH
jgi:hypothetical protein